MDASVLTDNVACLELVVLFSATSESVDKPETSKANKLSALFEEMVEPIGIEPTTSTLPV